MAYATEADIVELYGADALYVADHDGDGASDTAAVERALSSASDEIDSHLAVRYTVPLEDTPSVVRQWCVDIALYRLALSHTVLTEEHRTRYEDALKALKNVADGKQRLVFPADGGSTGEPEEDLGPNPIVTGGPEREFTRDKMRDL